MSAFITIHRIKLPITSLLINATDYVSVRMTAKGQDGSETDVTFYFSTDTESRKYATRLHGAIRDADRPDEGSVDEGEAA